MAGLAKESSVIVGFQRFESKAGKQAVRRDVMSDGMGHIDTTHSAQASVVKATRYAACRAALVYDIYPQGKCGLNVWYIV